jgi:hypothetical protein
VLGPLRGVFVLKIDGSLGDRAGHFMAGVAVLHSRAQSDVFGRDQAFSRFSTGQSPFRARAASTVGVSQLNGRAPLLVSARA